MTEGERRQLRRHLKDSLHLIDDTLELLEAREMAHDLTPRDGNLLQMWRRELEGEFARLDAKLWALRRGREGLSAPTDDQFEEIQNLADQVDDLVQGQKQTDTFIAFATKVVEAAEKAAK